MEGIVIPELELPGFRFHPTEQELLEFYLKNMVMGRRECFGVIGFLNIYHYDPWELPGLARNGEREWYFFVPRDKKVGRGGRPNRTTAKGFWKATGSDRRIFSTPDHRRSVLGLRKTLVFYKGRAPQGRKTDWVMNEYRLPDDSPLPKDAVLCKIYRKATSLKELEQRAAMEEGLKQSRLPLLDVTSPPSFQHYHLLNLKSEGDEIKELAVAADEDELQYDHHRHRTDGIAEEFQLQGSSSSSSSSSSSPSLQVPLVREKLTELQVPRFSSAQDWTQDNFWAQLNSPWLQALTPPGYANMASTGYVVP